MVPFQLLEQVGSPLLSCNDTFTELQASPRLLKASRVTALVTTACLKAKAHPTAHHTCLCPTTLISSQPGTRSQALAPPAHCAAAPAECGWVGVLGRAALSRSPHCWQCCWLRGACGG